LKPRRLPLLRTLVWLRDVFRIEGPLDEAGALDIIRADITFRGAKAWILVAAIFTASLGLNTNSAAVIIGAMLISPLMGPIVGMGAALAVWDVSLLTKSARNLAIAVGISLVTSSIYFLISPFGDAKSELVARTTPTLLDALIAIFGGIAGAVAAIRQDKSNVVPGVAIATALMPPLCTAGYGIAHLDSAFFLGAFYLFFVNGVCISAATYAVLRVAGFHKSSGLDERASRRVRRIVLTVVTVTLFPSVIIGYRIFQENAFEREVNGLVEDMRERFTSSSVLVTYKRYSSTDPRLELTIIGTRLDTNDRRTVDSLQQAHGLSSTTIVLRQAGDPSRLDRSPTLSTTKLLDLYTTAEAALATKNRIIDSLEQSLRGPMKADVSATDVMREASVVFSNLRSLSISPRTITYVRDGKADTSTTITADWAQRPSTKDVQSLTSWLAVRLKDSTIIVR